VSRRGRRETQGNGGAELARTATAVRDESEVTFRWVSRKTAAV